MKNKLKTLLQWKLTCGSQTGRTRHLVPATFIIRKEENHRNNGARRRCWNKTPPILNKWERVEDPTNVSKRGTTLSYDADPDRHILLQFRRGGLLKRLRRAKTPPRLRTTPTVLVPPVLETISREWDDECPDLFLPDDPDHLLQWSPAPPLQRLQSATLWR